MFEADGSQFVKLRNPWGKTEWNGKFSGKQAESWSEELLHATDMTLEEAEEDNGMFIMEFKDFV